MINTEVQKIILNLGNVHPNLNGPQSMVIQVGHPNF